MTYDPKPYERYKAAWDRSEQLRGRRDGYAWLAAEALLAGDDAAARRHAQYAQEADQGMQAARQRASELADALPRTRAGRGDGS